MPYMNGEEVLSELKVMAPSVKVLLSSGYNQVEAIRRFTGKGAGRVFAKTLFGRGARRNRQQDNRQRSFSALRLRIGKSLLIREIVADVDEDKREIVLLIHWAGGRHSETPT